MELQNAFYILGIIFMSVMLILIIALVAAVFVIRAKVIAIQNSIASKLDIVGQAKKAARSVKRSVTGSR